METLLVVLAVALASMYAIGVLSHLATPLRVANSLGELGLPGRLMPLVAGAEAGLASLLAVAPRAGGAASAGYLTVMTAYVAVAITLGGATIADCGCSFRVRPADRGFFLRNCGYIAMSLLVALGGAHANGWRALLVPLTAFGVVSVAASIRLRIESRRDQLVRWG